MSDEERQEKFNQLTMTFSCAKAFCNFMGTIELQDKRIDWDYSYREPTEMLLLTLNEVFSDTDWVKEPELFENKVNTLLLLG